MDDICYIYLGVILSACLCCFYRYRVLDRASKIFAFFVAISFACELLAAITARKYKNNMPVYAIYGLLEFCTISLYFNYSIDVFRRRYIGYVIGIVGVAFGIMNIVFFQGLNAMNSYFLIFEGVCIIGMGLFSFLRLFLKGDNIQIQYYHHFWLTTILVFFWTVSLTNWSLYKYFTIMYTGKMAAIHIAILVFNIFVYSSICYVFISFPKMQRKYAR